MVYGSINAHDRYIPAIRERMSSAVTVTASQASSQLDLPRRAPTSFNGDKFFWSYTEEPHRTRRQAIIKAHPEVVPSLSVRFPPTHFLGQVIKLCGPEPSTKYYVLAVVTLQTACAVLLRNTPVFSCWFILTAYAVGATANQNLFLAIHEISHNLAFKAPLANRILAILANLPIGIPYSAAFRVSSIGTGIAEATNLI